MINAKKMTARSRKNSELDSYDLKMLAALNEDGRMSITDLAKRVGLSKTPCQLRMANLLREGFIEGFKPVINPEKFALSHVAFTEVKLTNTKQEALQSFNAAIRKIEEVEECHMIAGRFDYLLKVRTRDIEKYREVLGERISALPFVASTSTSVVMQVVREGWRSVDQNNRSKT